jgi:hypothetical protein
MKKFTMFAFLFWSAFSVYGQLILSSGADMLIGSSSSVIANDVTNSGGTITNNGNLYIKGNLVNNTAALMASSSTGTVTFNGSSSQEITGDYDASFYGTLKIDNASGVALTSTSTGSNQTVNGTLTFVNGLLTLNGFDLTIGSADPTGTGSTKYIKTNSTGGVKRSVTADGSTNVIYPIGVSAYNPVTLQNAATGTTDDYTVRVVDNEPKSSVTSHMVNRSWAITEGNAGGSKLTVTPQWNSGDELTSFVRTNCAVGFTTDNGTTYNWKDYGVTTGTYTRSGSTFITVGTFAVADKDYVSDNTVVTDVDVANSETFCYNAVNVLTIALDETVSVENGGNADFIAGQKILFKPGFHSKSGSYSHAYITTSGNYCTNPSPPAAPPPAANTDEEDIASVANMFGGISDNNDLINVYPNPTNGSLTIDFLGVETTATIRVVNFQGGIILETDINKHLIKKLDLRFLPEGMYIIVINNGESQITKKIVKNY